MREMQDIDGGYYSTLDADSDGEEGKYYVWQETDLRAVLETAEYELAENVFGLFGDPNFEGNWHLNLNPETDHTLLSASADIQARIETLRKKLFDIREERTRPALDHKILAGWNGLMIGAMATAGRLLEDDRLVQSASRALDFVRNSLWQGDRW